MVVVAEIKAFQRQVDDGGFTMVRAGGCLELSGLP
jgi:hypothetical protein